MMQTSLLHHDEDKPVVCAWCTSRRLNVSSLLLALLGLALLLVAVFLPGVIQQKLDDGIDSFVSLRPDALAKQSQGFRTWSNTGDADAVPVYQSVYIFNITNPAEVLSTGASPRLTQHGPYTYRQIKRKWNFSYTSDYDNRELIEFREWTRYEFAPDQSGAGLDPKSDRYTTLNLPFQAVASVGQQSGLLGFMYEALINASCPGTYDRDDLRLFQSAASVDDLLFGYSSCVTQFIPASGLAKAGMFPGLLGPNLPANTNLTDLDGLINKDQVYTGHNEPNYARSYYSWKGQSSLSVELGLPTAPTVEPMWKSNEANRVYGTSGDGFRRDLPRGSTVVAWVEDLSRHTPLVNQDGARVSVHGIDLLRYTLDPRMLQNSSQVPANADYYQTGYTGLLDVSRAKSSLPIFMSKPHFLDGAPELAADAIGMHPQRDLHDTFLDVEPLSGMTLRAHKRLQINFRAAPVTFTTTSFQSATWYPNVGVHYVPVGYVDQHAEITSGKASDFRASVYGAQDAIKYLRILGAIFGALAVVVALQLLRTAGRRKMREAEESRHNINIYQQ